MAVGLSIFLIMSLIFEHNFMFLERYSVELDLWLDGSFNFFLCNFE